MSDKRKRAIRDLMAETGMSYCAAMRELDRRRDAAPGAEPTLEGRARGGHDDSTGGQPPSR